MTFRRSTATVLGAAALLAVTATTAHAGPPWTVSVGGSSTGAPAPFNATTVNGLEFSVPGIDLGCDSATFYGAITPGPTSSTVGQVTDSTYENCVGPLNLDFEVTQTSAWNIDLTGDNVAGVTPGEITNVNAHVADADGLCAFDLAGAKAGFIDENSQLIGSDNTTGPETLFVENVDQCFGLVLEGDPATVKATYALDGIAPITITN